MPSRTLLNGMVVVAGTACTTVWLTAAAVQNPGPQAHAQQTAKPGPTRTTVSSPLEAQAAVVKDYCLGCHNDKLKTGGLTLASFDIAHADAQAAVAEKVIRKLRAGMMPPKGAKRPDEAATKALVAALETRIDRAAAANPNPGWRPFPRLNRAEYARAVRELLDIDVDVDVFLPPDTVSGGFDNVADEQSFSPTLIEGYMRAASHISRLAVGDRNAAPGSAIYRVSRTVSQMQHVEGAPLGTRGGISVVHVFPADGEYTFNMLFVTDDSGNLFTGNPLGREHIEVSIDGERVALLEVDPNLSEIKTNGAILRTPPIHVKAGPQRVAAAFIQMADGIVDDLISPLDHTLAGTTGDNGALGITKLAHLHELGINGPYNVTGVSETASRRKIFTCRPTSAREEASCAAAVINRLATQAYRGRVTGEDTTELMRLYDQGRKAGGFESGIRLALQGVLSNTQFLFRLEGAPATMRAGQTYPVSDLDLASRLSFFLWETGPDAELIKVATRGTLKAPAVLERQVRRMLADPRSETLATRFASQWLRLQDLEKVAPDPTIYPFWDHTLSESFRRETELFFDNLVREDRSVLDLLNADYTFVNERSARHYGIPNVAGEQFRRVPLPTEDRRGILGHGSILMLTSAADRTSPVQRGKWVMEVLLGSPPPPPPPNVPDLEATKAVQGAKLLSVRERMEEHRANPACASCHRVIDPLGLALEGFDATGARRFRDNGVLVDSSGELYDGTKINGPVELRTALLKRADVVVLSFTESLMAYALGRRVEYYDMPAVRTIIRDAGRHENRMSSFILGVVKSGAFQMSAAKAVTSVARQD